MPLDSFGFVCKVISDVFALCFSTETSSPGTDLFKLLECDGLFVEEIELTDLP